MCPASHVSLVQASNSGVRCGEHFFGPLHHAMMLIWTKISENISLNVCNKELRQFALILCYSVFSGHLCNISKTTASCKISLPVISCLPAEFKNKGKNSTCLQ